MSTLTQFQKGYQEALADMFAAYQREGAAGMLKWTADNAIADRELAVAAQAASAVEATRGAASA